MKTGLDADVDVTGVSGTIEDTGEGWTKVET